MEDKEKRKKRNARYYLKRKLRQFKSPGMISKACPEEKTAYAKIIPLRKGTLSMPRESYQWSWDQVLGGVLLMALVGAMTIFLIRETYLYFFEAEKVSWLALLKAILCEGIILSFF